VNDAFCHPQRVVVLGATSEIATSLLGSLVDNGCHTLVLAGRDEAALSAVADHVRAEGARVVPVVLFDAADPGRAEELIDRSFEQSGGDVDLVLVAVGALGAEGPDELNPVSTERTLAVNFTWPATAMAAAGARLKHQGHGRIVVLSSVAGVRVRRSNFVYGSAKAGLDAYALGLGEALRGTGVGVTVVRPGFVRTKMTAGRKEAPFATTPTAVADAVLHGIETDATVVWVPPVLRSAFGVLRLLPLPLWRRLPA